MVTSVKLSAAARADLVDIRKFSNDQFSAIIANSYFMGFDEVFDLLRRHPRAGAAKPEFGKDIRCIVHRKHRIFYQFDGEVVLILRIIHHARNAKRELKRD